MIPGFVNESLRCQSTSWQLAARACPLNIGEQCHPEVHLEVVFGLHEDLILDECNLRSGDAVSRIIDWLSDALWAWCVARCTAVFYCTIFESMGWIFKEMLIYPVRFSRPDAAATHRHGGAVCVLQAVLRRFNKVFLQRVKI